MHAWRLNSCLTYQFVADKKLLISDIQGSKFKFDVLMKELASEKETRVLNEDAIALEHMFQDPSIRMTLRHFLKRNACMSGVKRWVELKVQGTEWEKEDP